MKPLLVSQRLIECREYPETREALDVRWGGFLHAAGLLAVPAPCAAPMREYFDRFSFAGLLLTGGNDLSSLSDAPVNRRRDEFERELLRLALARGLPVLGICRGMQFLAQFFGGRVAACAGHAGTSHPLREARDSAWGARLTEGRTVNSYHGCAVTALAPELRRLAAAPDGTTEAVEHLSLPVLGLMWHPERESPGAADDIETFAGFFGGKA